MTFKKMATLSITALCALAATSAQAADKLCDYDTGKFAILDSEGLGKCIQLRTTGNASKDSPVVWELTDSVRFASRCPVLSMALEDHEDTACSDVAASALHTGDSVRVDEWAKGGYQLLITRNGRSAFHYSQGPVVLTPVEVELERGSTRRIGYRAEKVMVYAETPTDPPVPVSYYVYLRTVVRDNHYIRWYDIEVFSDDADCRKEIPGSKEAGTAIATCPVLKPKKKAKEVEAMELPAGGGGEEPPGCCHH
ncbi:MAG: hypothetical protein WBP11_02400 [Dokdonella sp.]